jgi:hypothetical protein
MTLQEKCFKTYISLQNGLEFPGAAFPLFLGSSMSIITKFHLSPHPIFTAVSAT